MFKSFFSMKKKLEHEAHRAQRKKNADETDRGKNKKTIIKIGRNGFCHHNSLSSAGANKIS